MTTPISIAEDRSLKVPYGTIVRTCCISVWDIELACRDRMAIGDVEKAFLRVLNCGDNHPFPCPVGKWSDKKFILYDGRHEYIAHLMLGKDKILVAWVCDKCS